MMKAFPSITALVAGIVVATGVFAQASIGTDQEAQKLASAAAARIAQVGKEQALKEFGTDAQWKVKDLTVWVMDTQGVMQYHVNPKMVGKDLLEVKDQSGRAYNKEMVAIGKGTKPGSIQYEWAHPETKKLVPKVAFLAPAPTAQVFAGVSVTH